MGDPSDRFIKAPPPGEGDEREVINSLGFLDLRVSKPGVQDALDDPNPRKSLGKLLSYWNSFEIVGWTVHKLGANLKDGIDCEAMSEMTSFWGDGAVLQKLPEYMEKLGAAAKDTFTYFRRSGEDLDDDEMRQRYLGLARLAAMTVHAYYGELYNRDPKSAREFSKKVQGKLMLLKADCGQKLKVVRTEQENKFFLDLDAPIIF